MEQAGGWDGDYTGGYEGEFGGGYDGGGYEGGYESFTVTASHSYVAADANELSFDKGSRILVYHTDKSGWWEGSLLPDQNTHGVFPSNHVKRDEITSTATLESGADNSELREWLLSCDDSLGAAIEPILASGYSLEDFLTSHATTPGELEGAFRSIGATTAQWENVREKLDAAVLDPPEAAPGQDPAVAATKLVDPREPPARAENPQHNSFAPKVPPPSPVGLPSRGARSFIPAGSPQRGGRGASVARGGRGTYGSTPGRRGGTPAPKQPPFGRGTFPPDKPWGSNSSPDNKGYSPVLRGPATSVAPISPPELSAELISAAMRSPAARSVAAQSPSSDAFCFNCGARGRGNQFCSKCGADMSSDEGEKSQNTRVATASRGRGIGSKRGSDGGSRGVSRGAPRQRGQVRRATSARNMANEVAPRKTTGQAPRARGDAGTPRRSIICKNCLKDIDITTQVPNGCPHCRFGWKPPQGTKPKKKPSSAKKKGAAGKVARDKRGGKKKDKAVFFL